MIRSILLVLFLISSVRQNIESHPIHLSVTTIEYDEANHEFEIFIKIFTDDFETIINKTYDVNLNLGKENELNESEKYILKYLQAKLEISVNRKDIFNYPELIRKEHNLNENLTLLTYKVKYHGGKKVIITNTLLTDLYSDQKNLLIFTYKNTQEAFKFEKNKSNFEFYIK
jgi:hypothetical protein